MQFKAIVNKTAAAAIASSMVLMAVAPVAQGAIYESVPSDGIRLSLIDTGSDLATLWVDMDPREDVETYDLGSLFVYGNGELDDDTPVADNSFDNLQVEFGAGTFPSEFAIISKNVSNSSVTVYDVLAFDGNTSTAYTWTDTDDVPSLSTSSLEDFYTDAVDNGTDYSTLGTTTVTGTTSFAVDSLAQASVSNSDVQQGDPDIITSYHDELYVYWNDGTDEYAFVLDLTLGSAMQDASTPEVTSLNTTYRQTRGRIDFGVPSLDGTSGITAFEVEISGCTVDSDGDGYAVQGTDTTGVTYETHFPVVFYNTEVDDSCDITVSTINGENDSSEGVEVQDVEFEVFEIGDMLSDVAGTTFEDHITYLYKLGFIDGFSDGTFRPDDQVTRGQYAKFLVNVFNLPLYLTSMPFSDVPSDHSLAVYIMALRAAGVTEGFSDGTFRPDAPITRAEASTMTVRAARYFDKDSIDDSAGTCFPDISGNVHQSSICALADHNDDEIAPIIGGFSSGDFMPDEVLTRGQMSKISLNAGASIEVVDLTTGDDDTFINITTPVLGTDVYDGNTFVRPFMAPGAVSDFDANTNVGSPTSQIDLTWDDLANADDTSVNGYIIEQKECDESEDQWDTADGVANGIYTTSIGTAATQTFNVTSLSDDTCYDFRIAPFKYIPFDFANDEYADQNTYIADVDDDYENILIGPFTKSSDSTDEN